MNIMVALFNTLRRNTLSIASIEADTALLMLSTRKFSTLDRYRSAVPSKPILQTENDSSQQLKVERPPTAFGHTVAYVFHISSLVLSMP